MKELKYVEPVYTVAEKHLLYTRALDGNRRLDIIARPIDPCIGDLPYDIEAAFESVIWNETDLKEDDLCAPVVWESVKECMGDEKIRVAALKLARDGLLAKVPNLKYDSRTAYICPVISEYGDGYRRGYVVAWGEHDALDVAEFMAGGRVDIYLDLLDSNGEYLGGDFLGDLGYSNIDDDTDDYHRLVAGETFRSIMEIHLGIEAPEPRDPEFPGAELLETFTKLD